MDTPGFPSGTLDEDGYPIWLSEMAEEEPNAILHLVRDMSPDEVLRGLEADPSAAVPCTLPAERPKGVSMPKAAFGSDSRAMSVLLAGRIGGWTFVYDDAGATVAIGGLPILRRILGAAAPTEVPESAPEGGWDATSDPAEVLSAAGGPAITLHECINGLTSLTYAVNGRAVFRTNSDDVDGPFDDELPAEVRGADDAAGTIAELAFEPGERDPSAVARFACALAGASWTMADLRAAPLRVVELH